MSSRILLAVMLLGLVASGTASATDSDPDSTHVADTVLFDGKALLEHASPVTSPIDFEKRRYQNPTAGLLKSMLIPGWGQLGNKRYVKAVFFAGLDAWFVAAAIHYGGQASDFYDQYETTLDTETRREYYNLYLNRKDNRNKYTWFAVIVTFVSMFDAYVDAHLSGYPKKTDDNEVSFEVRPTDNGGFLASVSVGF